MSLGFFHSHREPVKVFTRGRRKSRPVLCVVSVQNRLWLSLHHSPSQASRSTVPASVPFSPLAALPTHGAHVRTFIDLCLCPGHGPLGSVHIADCSVRWAIGKTLLVPVPSFHTHFCVSPLKTKLTASAGTWVFHC